MTQPAGRNVPLSVSRRFIGDVVHFARQMPTVPLQRRMRLAPVAAARAAALPKPGWCAIFLKAYSFGAAALHLLSPLTTALNYGVIDDHGEVDVRLTYDQRVLDAGTAARALEDLGRVLKCEIVAELRYLTAADAA